MNLVKTAAAHPHLRDDEALVVENAIRLAIDSIINVLYGVNSARSHEFQRMVADRDKEIQRLESRLREIEHELQGLRRRGCACGLLRGQLGLGGCHSSGDPQPGEQSGFSRDRMDAELAAEQQECEMSISLGLFARPPSHVSSQSQETALPSSPGGMGLDPTCTPHSSEASAVSEAAMNLPTSPGGGVVVKEEPCDIDAVLIKWEMSEERSGEFQERAGGSCHDTQSSAGKKTLESREGRQFREKPQAEPGGQRGAETEHLRNKKKSVPMSELPEEAQRLKRAAWRAASRRYYARKIARQQAAPSRAGPFHHFTDAQYSHPVSPADRRRSAQASELPQESQTLQREAWRAASKRYYARKVARHQTQPAQYQHFLQSLDRSGGSPGAGSGGSHTSSGGLGGIMCS